MNKEELTKYLKYKEDGSIRSVADLERLRDKITLRALDMEREKSEGSFNALVLSIYVITDLVKED